MKSNPQLEFRGTTGDLSLAPDGSLVRRLQWARFVDGRAEPLGPNAAIAQIGAAPGQ